MKLYYFYSESYLFYHQHIQERLTKYMDLYPIVIPEIPEIKNAHHFTGLTIKIELIIDAITQSMGSKSMGETIVFSDATIFIHPENASKLVDYLKMFDSYDLAFIDESVNSLYNIGFITIKCSKKTLTFFQNVLAVMKIINHDQVAVNYMLQHDNLDLNYIMYDHRIFFGDFREELRDTFIIYKSGIRNIGKNENFNQRIQNFYNYHLIDRETYEKWYISPILSSLEKK